LSPRFDYSHHCSGFHQFTFSLADVTKLTPRVLPPGNIARLYVLYSVQCEEQGQGSDACCFSTFWRTWMATWRKVLSFNCRSEHMCCDECYKFKICRLRKRSSATDLLVEEFQTIATYRKHLNGVWQDRSFLWQAMDQAFNTALDKSQSPPFLMVICDGMDQAKWRLPRWPGFMKTHMLGSLIRPSVIIEGVWIVGFRLDLLSKRVTLRCAYSSPPPSRECVLDLSAKTYCTDMGDPPPWFEPGT
jgi:hypothetical protein